MELNALSVGSWVPHDVTGLTNRVDPSSQLSPSEKARFDKRNLPNPFTGCYLYTNVNDSGVQLDVEKELPAVVSDFLYQKIVTARAAKLDDLDKMENVENRSDTAELNEKTKEKLRSKAFLTFGIKRIAVPEEEIKEYLTSQFACQAALQLSFCNWPDQTQVGFTKDKRPNNFPIYVTLKENLAKWRMSDEHLTQSIGILPDDNNSKDWKSLPNEWQSLAAAFKDLARQGDDGKWLDRLETLYNDRFENNFRKMGVKRFYEVKLRSRRDIIRVIRDVVEAELFAEVKDGIKSVPEVGLLVTELIKHTEERLRGIASNIQKQRDKEPAEAAAISANKGEWAKLGPLSRLFLKKHERLLDAQSLCLEKLYITRTQIEALEFAKQLLRDLITELNDLKVEVDHCDATIAAGLKFFEDSSKSLCDDKGEMDLRQNVIRFYQPENVRQVSKSFVKDIDMQRTQTSAVRAKLSAELGEKQTFANFNLRIGREKFIELCQCQCAVSVEDVHDAFVRDARGKGRLFGVNIIEKLEERYGSEPTELKALITELVEHSGVLLPFDETEVDKANEPSIPKSVPAEQLFLVIRPQDPARKTFVNMLETEFKDCCKGHTVIFTDSVGKTNEIALIRITNFFPLRFVEPLGFLKEKYDLRINEVNSERPKLEIHLEGDGTQHNSLYSQKLGDMQREGLPYVLLAKPLGFIQTIESHATGVKQLALIRLDADGLPLDPIMLGKSIADACEHLDLAATEEIQQLVKAALVKPENLRVEKRAALQTAVTDDFRELLQSRGNDISDPVCKQFRDAAQKANRILKGEN